MSDLDHSNRAHAKLSASGSAMWLNCAGSVAANANYEDTTSPYAEEGTAAHELAEMCLRSGDEPFEYVGTVINDHTVDDAMARHVASYIDYVHGLMTPDSHCEVEKRVEFTDYVPEAFGTADAIVFNNDGVVHICDLKYGQGVSVSAENNTQGQLYALGVLQEYGAFVDIKRIEIHIIQPRKDNYSSWSVSVEALAVFGEYVKQRAQAALVADAPRTPSEKACRWCKHKANCVELAEHTSQIIGREFDQINIEVVESIDQLSDERKADIIQHKGLVEMFLKAVEESVFKQISDGGTFAGYKIVEGRSNRRWTDNAEAVLVEKLGEQAYNKKLIGVSDAQKHLGKGVVDELTEKPAGKPTLVPDTDKRKALDFTSVEDAFSEV